MSKSVAIYADSLSSPFRNYLKIQISILKQYSVLFLGFLLSIPLVCVNFRTFYF